MDDNLVRLQKFISGCGLCSRRKAEELIADKKVTVNGKVANIGDKIDPIKDFVTVLGKNISPPKSNVYIALYKPRGYLTTLNDELNRKIISDLVFDIDRRVYPIGRLDKDSEGLILLTDDGEFHNLVEHPKHSVSKTYRVTVRPRASDETITKMMTEAANATKSDNLPVKIDVISSNDDKSVLEFVLTEGKNRQIRKLCQGVGLEVVRLKRIAIGPVKLGHLEVGKWRALTQEELNGFKQLKSR